MMLRQLSAFLLVGAARTALSYALYLGLLQILSYRVAFTITYVVTLLCSIFINGTYVFRTQLTPVKGVRYAAVYCLNYVLGFGVLAFAITVLGMRETVAPLLVIVIMFPIGFLTERYALTR